jgi:hypothetical protein
MERTTEAIKGHLETFRPGIREEFVGPRQIEV